MRAFLRAWNHVYNQVIMKQVKYFSLSWLVIQYCCGATKRFVVIKCSLARPIKSGVSGCQVSCFLAAARHWQTWCQIFRWLTPGWPHLSVWTLVMGVWTSCHLRLILLAFMYLDGLAIALKNVVQPWFILKLIHFLNMLNIFFFTSSQQLKCLETKYLRFFWDSVKNDLTFLFYN